VNADPFSRRVYLVAHPSLSIPAIDAFQLQLTPFNSTPTTTLSDANDGGLPGTSHPRRARGPLLSERAELLARAGDCDAAIECAKAAVDAHELEAGVKGVSKASTRAARTLAFAHKKNGDEGASRLAPVPARRGLDWSPYDRGGVVNADP